MNIYSIIGAFVITLSLLAYGIGSISLVRFRLVGTIVLTFLSLGIFFDVVAISLMIIGARDSIFSTHAIVGYISFVVMLILALWVWKNFMSQGKDSKASIKLVAYTKMAYFVWVSAYLLGSIMVIWR